MDGGQPYACSSKARCRLVLAVLDDPAVEAEGDLTCHISGGNNVDRRPSLQGEVSTIDRQGDGGGVRIRTCRDHIGL